MSDSTTILTASRRELEDPASEVRRAMDGSPTLEAAAAGFVVAERSLAEAWFANPGAAPSFPVMLRSWQRRRWHRAVILASILALGMLVLMTLVGLALALWGVLVLARETLTG